MCIVYYTILDYASYRHRYNIFSVREAFQSKIPAVFKHVFTTIAKIKVTCYLLLISTGGRRDRFKLNIKTFMFVFCFSSSFLLAVPSASLCEYFVLTYFY